jgi:hypothetical protein
VVFYSDDRRLIDRLSEFIWSALKSGNAAVVFATDYHRDGLMQRLRAYGVDIAAVIEQGRYIAFDAADAVSTMMVNGVLEADRFLESYGEVILKAANAASREHPRVALFGEGADLMWKQGSPEAAIQDEKLGNELSKRFDVDILCGYSLHNVQGVADEEMVQRISAEHSGVYRL